MSATSLRLKLVGAASLLALLIMGCNDEPQAATAGDGELEQVGAAGGGSDLPCDVEPILKKACATCHGAEPSFGAPMPLVTAADFQKAALSGEKMTEVTKTRINATDPRRLMPPTSGVQLTAAEKATLTAWLDKGAPARTGSCSANPANPANPTEPSTDDDIAHPDTVDTSGMECYKLTAYSGTDLKSKYKVGAARDAYFNFVFKAPWTGTLYAKVFRPVIDNKNAIHHWLLFQDSTPLRVGPAQPSVGAHPGSQLLSGWAPGGEATNLTAEGEDVAQDLPGNTTYTMEFHYNSTDPNALDASGVEICGTKTPPKNLAGLAWLGWDQLLLPAQKWVGTCRPQGPLAQKPIRIIGVTPHMHKQGTHMKATINRANGTKEILHDAPFDFEYQRSYKKNVTINPGDTITTECTYAKPMSFGQATTQEMCYLFTLSYPKGALRDNGLWGGVAHGGGACLGQ